MRDLTQGPIPGHLVAMAVPIAVGMLAQTLYFLIDLYFVARLGDFLRRSNIGALVTRRSVSETGPGESYSYGIDGNFSFYDNLDITTSIARTDNEGLSGSDLSYRANFDYNGDRYGVQAERLVIEENFNPQVGFLQRGDVRRNFGLLRFSPRPSSDAIRKLIWDASVDYITDNSDRLETRTIEAGFGIDLPTELLLDPQRQRRGNERIKPEIADQILVGRHGRRIEPRFGGKIGDDLLR